MEHHAHAGPQVRHVDLRAVEIDAVQENGAVETGAFHEVIEAIQAAEQGGFAASGRSDERRHLILRDI